MIKTISYVLPDSGTESQVAFALLRSLFQQSEDSEKSIIRLSAGAGFTPETCFRLESCERAFLEVVPADQERFILCLPNPCRDGIGIPFADASKQICGHITGVDYTGVSIPHDIEPSIWTATTNFLATHGSFYNYPPLENGYNPDTMRWLFVVPNNGNKEANIRRQPKFEMLFDRRGDQEPALVIINMETQMTQAKIERLFPENQSFSIEGLEDCFRSVMIQTPWKGMEIMRFDLRFKGEDAETITDWGSGLSLFKHGQIVLPNAPATYLPQPS